MSEEQEEQEELEEPEPYGQPEWPPVKLGGIMDGADVSEDEFRATNPSEP